MTIIDTIKRRFLCNEITSKDIDRYVNEKMITPQEAVEILQMKLNTILAESTNAGKPLR